MSDINVNNHFYNYLLVIMETKIYKTKKYTKENTQTYVDC